MPVKKEVKEDVAVDAPVKKKEGYSLEAKYKTKGVEGETIVMSFDSRGETVKELLDNLEFTKGVNCLVNVKVTHGDRVFERALAPHKARLVLELRSLAVFESLFRGV